MRSALVLVVVAIVAAAPEAQRADGRLAEYINSIRAVDNHSHVVAPDPEHDRGFDALPCDAAPAGPGLLPFNMRFGPGTLAAWKALYNFSGTSGDDRELQAAGRANQAARQREGDRYFAWVLDRAGIDTALANRVSMAQELASPRFRWVPYGDALLFPLDNSAGKAQTPDRKVFYEHEERLLQTYVQAGPLSAMPSTLEHYVEFVAWTLGRQKDAGAVAIKFEAAYLRSLDFAPADRAAAEATFAEYHSSGVPPAAAYKNLQDYLFRIIVAEAGRLGLAVHVHTGSGCGDWFDIQGGQPMLLSSVLNDPRLRGTNVVLLHGGSPFERTMAALIQHSNTFVDSSVLAFLWSPGEVAKVLRPWLESMPEHVLFGTDAGPFGPGMGWEETTWLGSRNFRQGLTIALTEMLDDHVVTPAQAREIAGRVLRQNAVDLYHLNPR